MHRTNVLGAALCAWLSSQLPLSKRILALKALAYELCQIAQLLENELLPTHVRGLVALQAGRA